MAEGADNDLPAIADRGNINLKGTRDILAFFLFL